MSKKNIIISSIISLLFIIVFAFCLTWTIINWNTVQSGMSGTTLYTKDDLDKAKQDGYNDGIKDKNEYISLIDEYRDTIINNNDEISVLNKTIKEKNDLIIEKNNKISENEKTINSLNSELENKDITLAEKEAKIESLTRENDSLRQDIIEISDEILSYKNSISDLEKDIDSLNKSIEYYKKFITALETDSQAVATFIYDGSVYSILKVQKGSTVTLANPKDTAYLTFNGWYVDGELVSLENYPLNENTTFTANLTYSYDVIFTVDEEDYNSQIIVKDSYPTVPSAPTKKGYIFKGWSLNGVSLIDPATTAITRNTTFTAVFEKVHSVEFKLDGNTISSQSIENNDLATIPEVSEYYQINYWTVDGERVNVATYPITKGTVFIANFTRKYDVKFMFEDTEFNKQLVLDGSTPNMVTPDNTDYKEFKGWSLDKTTIVDITTNPITEATIYYAIIEYSYDVKFMIDSTLYVNQIIKTNGYPTMPTNPTKVGFDFDGWSLDGKTIIDVTTIQITDTTEFKAVFTQLFTVKFNYENTIVDSQVIRNEESPTSFTVNDTDRVKFQGWSLDKTNIIDVNTVVITSDTIFYAVVIYCYKVDFVANDSVRYSVFVENGKNATYNGSLEVGDYDISGWTLDGDSVNLSNCTISEDATFIATLKRARITTTGDSTSAYSITDNSSSAGVVIYNFKLTELMTEFSSVNSAKIEVTVFGQKFSIDSSKGTVAFFYDNKLGISCNPSNGGWALYIYDSVLLSISLELVITPYYSSGISGL